MVKSHSIYFNKKKKKMKLKTSSRARLVLLSSVKQIGKELELRLDNWTMACLLQKKLEPLT
jgi:hypothetical protein